MSGRGADPLDARAFGPEAGPVLRDAVADLSWLLGRGYAAVAALTLVGDRHQLTDRQRRAVSRGACSDDALARRRANRVPWDATAPLAVDGFNVLIGLERGLSGGPLFRGRDGALRDLAGVHGSWRRSEATEQAVARLVAGMRGPVTWVLDRPVSNSGRLAASLRSAAAVQGLPWTVDVVDDADSHLLRAGLPIATGDGWLLEQARWVPLVEALLAGTLAWIVDLGR